VTVVCLTLVTSKPRLTSPSDVPSAGVLCSRWHITAFIGFRIWGRTSNRAAYWCRSGADGLGIRLASHDDSGSVSSATEFKVLFGHTSQLLLQLNQVGGRR
jgi:hypothetical protein